MINYSIDVSDLSFIRHSNVPENSWREVARVIFYSDESSGFTHQMEKIRKSHRISFGKVRESQEI